MNFVIVTRRSPRHVWARRADVVVPPNDIQMQVGKFVEAHRVLGDTKSEVVAIRVATFDDYGLPKTGDRGPLAERVERDVVIRVVGTDIITGRDFDPRVGS